jgi:hypothetical protein
MNLAIFISEILVKLKNMDTQGRRSEDRAQGGNVEVRAITN